MSENPSIICIASGKGGVGKTTTAAALAYLFASIDKKQVLLIDADAQVNLTQTMNVTMDGRCDIQSALMSRMTGTNVPIEVFIKNSQYKNIDMIPGNPLIEKDDFLTRVSKAMVEDVINLWEEVVNSIIGLQKYDVIIMDTHPSSGIATSYPMRACNEVLIPLEANERSVSGFATVYKEILKTRKKANPKIRLLGYFFNKVKTQTNAAKEYVPSAMEQLPLAIKRMNDGQEEGVCFKTIIRASEDAQKAINYHAAVTARGGVLTEDFKNLYREIKEVL